jgi:glycine cleavage system H protein
MSKEKREQNENNSIEETPHQLSRREFLQGAGVVVGGVTLASLALASACKNTTDTAPPTSNPPTLKLAEGASVVASDRKYSVEHIWVKSLTDGRVAVGITDKLRRLMGSIDSLELYNSNTEIKQGQVFGSMGGGKMNVDLTSPVSGQIVQIDNNLISNPMPINIGPYKEWFEVIKLSKPDELKELLSPEEYADLQSQTGNGMSDFWY